MNSYYSANQMACDEAFHTQKNQLSDSDYDTNDTSSQCSHDSMKKLGQFINQYEIEYKLFLTNINYLQCKAQTKIVSLLIREIKVYYGILKKMEDRALQELCAQRSLPIFQYCINKSYYQNFLKCCFAHGNQELQKKNDFNQSYKTKPCKKYFLSGYCPYGYRCQYLHNDIKNCPQFYNFLLNLYKQKNMIIDTRLPMFYSYELNYLSETEQALPVSSRLKVFQEINTNSN